MWRTSSSHAIPRQLERLLSQLEDIENLKDEFSPEEYESSKKDTIAQLEEFQESLHKMSQGNMTLHSELDATRMAVRAAISDAFKTPEVIRMFATKKPAALRQRLAEIDRDVKLGKYSFADVTTQATEILVALKKLGEPLQPKEEAFLQQNMTDTLSAFEEVDESDGGVNLGGVLKGKQ